MSGALSGQTAVVTGASRGLGKAISLELAGMGAAVAACDIDFTGAKGTATEAESLGPPALPVEMDVSDVDSIQRALDEIDRTMGGYNILVNNAGIDVTVPITDLDPSDWRAVIDVNLTGPFLLSREAFMHMGRSTRRGHIVNIVSTAAKRSWANASAYHASKWGLLGLSHSLHVEGRQAGIAVTAVVAGGMRTPFILERFPDTDVSLLQDPSGVARVVGFVLTSPEGTVIPEVMALPTHETSWP